MLRERRRGRGGRGFGRGGELFEVMIDGNRGDRGMGMVRERRGEDSVGGGGRMVLWRERDEGEGCPGAIGERGGTGGAVRGWTVDRTSEGGVLER